MFMDNIKKLLEDENFIEAEKQIRKTLKTNSEDHEILYLLAYCLFNLGKYKEALKIKLSSDSRSLHLRGYCYFLLNEHEKAEKNLLNALELKSDNSHIHYLLGQLYSRTNNADKSLYHLHMAKEGGINYTDLYEELGKIHFSRGEFEKALRNYFNLIIIKPYDPLIYYMTGRCFLNLSNYKEAVKYIKGSIEKGLDNSFLLKARHLLALAYCGNKKFNSAEKVMREAIKKNLDYYSYYDLLGRILLSRMDYRRAREVFNKILTRRLKPEEEAMFNIAFTYILENKVDTAIHKLESILIKWENHLKTHYTLGTLYFYINNKEKAREHWKVCAIIDPGGFGEKVKDYLRREG